MSKERYWDIVKVQLVKCMLADEWASWTGQGDKLEQVMKSLEESEKCYIVHDDKSHHSWSVAIHNLPVIKLLFTADHVWIKNLIFQAPQRVFIALPRINWKFVINNTLNSECKLNYSRAALARDENLLTDFAYSFPMPSVAPVITVEGEKCYQLNSLSNWNVLLMGIKIFAIDF